MGLGMGSNGFGARSSRGTGACGGADADKDLSGFDEAQAAPLQVSGSGLSDAALAAHASALAVVKEEAEGGI